MDFRVEITDPAIADLAEIVSYIARDNPDAARALDNNLLDAALSLAQVPYKGSPYQNACRHSQANAATVQNFLSREPDAESRGGSTLLALGANRAEALICGLTSDL